MAMNDWELFKEAFKEDPVTVILVLIAIGSFIYLLFFDNGLR